MTAVRRAILPIHAAAILAAVAFGAVFVVQAAQLHQDRAGRIERLRTDVEARSIRLAQHADGVLRRLDDALSALGFVMEDGGGDHLTLQRRIARTLPQGGCLSWLRAAAGAIVSSCGPIHGLSPQDPAVRSLLEGRETVILSHDPFSARAMARRGVFASEGAVIGVLQASFDSAELLGNERATGLETVALIADRDGTMVAGPELDFSAQRTALAQDGLDMMLTADRSLDGIAIVEGDGMIVGVAQLRSWPLIAVTVTPTGPILAEWRRTALLHVGAAAVFGLGAILLFRRLFRIQREAARSEQRLALALDATNDALWDWDVRTGAVYFSPRWQTMLGWNPGEIAPDIASWQDRVHPEDAQRSRDALLRHFLGETDGYACEHRLMNRAGEWIWVLDRGRVVERDEEGHPLRMVGTHTEITERKRVEAEIRASRALLDAVLENAPVGVAIVDAERRFVRVNRALCDMLLTDADHLVGASTRAIYPDQATFDHVGARGYPTIDRGETFTEEVRLRRSDGSVAWCRLYGRRIAADDPEQGSVWVVEDVTERRKAEEALRERSEFQRVLIDTVPIPIFVKNERGRYIQINGEFERWLGVDRRTFCGRTVRDIAPPEIARIHEESDRALLEKGGTQVYEGSMILADGTSRDVMYSKAVFEREPGAPAGIVGAVLDITERKRNEEALRERHALFEATFSASLAVKLLLDPETGAIVDANGAAAAFYGHELDALRGMSIFDVSDLSPDDMRRELERMRLHQREYIQSRHRLATGEIRDVEVYAGPIDVRGRTLLLLLVHDITERRHAESALHAKTSELEQSNAELEAFAYVASHDLRQPLRTINSYLGLLGRKLAGTLDDEGEEFMGFVRDGARRMDRLIVDLLEYSRVGRRSRPFAPVSLLTAVEAARASLEAAIAEAGAAVTVETRLPTIHGDENELVRLFQNLIGNAVKYRRRDHATEVRIEACEALEGWRISVTDNGIGIPPEHRERVFGIFQRLHPRGEYEGTGIGLAVCRKVAEHHGGRIWIGQPPDGEPGAVFHIALPRAPSGAPRREAREEAPAGA